MGTRRLTTSTPMPDFSKEVDIAVPSYIISFIRGHLVAVFH